MNFFKEFFTSGAIVNFVLITIGSLIGVFFKRGMPVRLNNALITGMALCVILIGINGALNDKNNILLIIISFAVGAVIGELLDLDTHVNKLGEKIEKSFNKKGGNSKIAEGFVTATLLFCVGAMAIVGSIDSGIRGDNTTLYSKSVIDGISSIALASGLGIGVAVSAYPVLLLEGGLTLLASIAAPVLTEEIVIHMSSIGSLLIIAIGLNMLGVTKIKVMNYVPAVFLPILLCQFM